MRKFLYIFPLLLIYQNTFGQNFDWAVQYGAASSGQDGRGVTLDAAGNVYSTGSFQGIVDFDPGPGTYTLNAIGQSIFVSKMDASGNFIMAKHFECKKNANNLGFSIKVDGPGNIYISGNFADTVDFDPGISTFTLSVPGTWSDGFVTKLDPLGNLVWVSQIEGPTYEYLLDMAIDPSANVFLTGSFSNMVDFDPGPGTYTLTTGSLNRNSFITKLNSNGSFGWAKQIVCSNTSQGEGICLGPTGNVITTGGFYASADFDPGPATYIMTNTGSSWNGAYISMLDGAGNFVWAKQIDGDGAQGSSIKSDAAGNIYNSGSFFGSCDFDPGPGTFSLTASGAYPKRDVYITKLNSSGSLIWAKKIGGTDDDWGWSLSIDNLSNVYTYGWFYSSTIDLDPGAGTFNLTNFGNTDVYISKLNSSGNFAWGAQIGGPSYEGPEEITVSGSGDVHVIGTFLGPCDFDPSAATYSYSAIGGQDVFIVKLACVPPTLTVSSTTSICTGGSATLSVSGANTYTWSTGSNSTSIVVSPTTSINYTVTGTYSATGCFGSITQSITVNPLPTSNAGSSQTITCAFPTANLSGSGVSSYTWSGPGIVSGGNTANPVVNAPGVYSLTGSLAGCVSNTSTITVMSNTVVPSVTATNSSPICAGQTATLSAGGSANSFTWSTGAFTQTTVVSPMTNTSYTLTGMNSVNGCTASATTFVFVNPLPTVTVVGPGSAVCSGTMSCLSASASPSGATYVWSGPCGFTSSLQNPCFPFYSFCGCVYTVTVTTSSGCSNTATICTNVVPNPTLTTSTSNTLICTGQTSTLTSNGALTYSWSTSATGSTTAVSPTVNTNYTVTGTDSNGCIGSDTITQYVSACTGINLNQINSYGISLYPNPTSGELILKSSQENLSVEIYNVIAEMILTQKITEAETKLDLKEFAKGIYFVEISEAGKLIYIQKIIKE